MDPVPKNEESRARAFAELAEGSQRFLIAVMVAQIPPAEKEGQPSKLLHQKWQIATI
jgi:hypothetical protein